jgi:hypothetical protein
MPGWVIYRELAQVVCSSVQMPSYAGRTYMMCVGVHLSGCERKLHVFNNAV